MAIIGQGVIGLAMLSWSMACGFRTVVVDRDPTRLEMARAMGADLAVSADQDDCVMQVTEYLGGEGADVVFEAASSWEGIRTALRVARTDGTVVVMSRHISIPEFNPVGYPFLGKRLNLITTYGYPPDGHRWDQRHSVALTLDFLARGRIVMDSIVTDRLPADELPAVYDRIDRGETSVVGVLIEW